MPVSPDEITFDAQVFLLTKQKAQALLKPAAQPVGARPGKDKKPETAVQPTGGTGTAPTSTGTGVAPKRETKSAVIRVRGAITPEVWNKLGVRLLPRLRAGANLRLSLDFTCEFAADDAAAVETELKQALADLRLTDMVQVSLE